MAGVSVPAPVMVSFVALGGGAAMDFWGRVPEGAWGGRTVLTRVTLPLLNEAVFD